MALVVSVPIPALFVIIMLVIKYQLLYKKYGRDDVTGGKNKKGIRADCQRFASRGWKLCCRMRTLTVLS